MATVETVVTHLVDGRDYSSFLPPGVQAWYASGTATGTATEASQQRIDLQFNPTSGRLFQPYVSVHHVGIQLTGANTADNVDVALGGEDWEKSSDLTGSGVTQYGVICAPELRDTVSDNDRVGSWSEVFYCGRTIQGRNGTIYLRTKQVSGLVLRVNLSGFFSDMPFVPMNDWRI